RPGPRRRGLRDHPGHAPLGGDDPCGFLVHAPARRSGLPSWRDRDMSARPRWHPFSLLLLLGWPTMEEMLPQTAAAGPRPVIMSPRYKVRVDRNVSVPVRDGTKLMADLTRPDQDGRYPAILEYLPYRKDDLSQGDDTHHYFAERGFVAVRLDVRG